MAKVRKAIARSSAPIRPGLLTWPVFTTEWWHRTRRDSIGPSTHLEVGSVGNASSSAQGNTPASSANVRSCESTGDGMSSTLTMLLYMATRWRSIGLAIAVFLLVLSTGGVAAAGPSATGDWRQPRFDAGRSGYNSAETRLSPFHARHLRRIWGFHTPAFVWGPPAVVGHRIFLASQSEHETGAVQALDVSTGRRIWSKDLGCPMGPLTLVQGALIVGGSCADDPGTGVPLIVGLRPFDGRVLWGARGMAPTLAVQHKGLFG